MSYMSEASSGRAIGQRASSAHYHACVSQHKPIGPRPTRRPREPARIRTHSPRLCMISAAVAIHHPLLPLADVLSVRGIMSLLLPASYVMHVCMCRIEEAGSASLRLSTPPKSNLCPCHGINKCSNLIRDCLD